MKRKILTDVELRAHWSQTRCASCRVAPGTILTPAARDFLREQNPKEWEFWMYRCVKDPDTGETFGWGRVLDYLGIAWEGPVGAMSGQIALEGF